MAGVDLAARAHQLRERGATRQQAATELNRAAAVGDLKGLAYTNDVAIAIVEAYDGDEPSGTTDMHGSRTTAGHATPPTTSTDEGGREGTASEGPRLLLPPWGHVMASDPPKRSPALIDGVLRLGHVGLLVGRPKTGKSWAAIELCVAVASGGRWMGMQCRQGRCLFIDPEIHPASLDNRFAAVAQAMGVAPSAIDYAVCRWSLRGVTTTRGEPPTMGTIATDLEAMSASGTMGGDTFSLVVVDSASALLQGSENDSHDVRRFFNDVLRVARATGAGVLLTHHESRAASGDRMAIERGRGSSVWGDAPDAPLSLVELFPPSGEVADYLPDGARAFALEDSGLREFPPREPAHVIYRYPLHVPDADGITAEWKPRSSQQVAGRASGESRKAKSAERANVCTCALLSHMYRHDMDSAEGIAAKEAAEICSTALGTPIKAATLKGYVEQSDWLSVYQRSPQRWAVVPTHPRPASTARNV